LNKPLEGGGIGGVYTLNATLDTNGFNITNVSFYYKIDAGSWVMIGSLLNVTAQQTDFTVSFTSTSIPDEINMTFNTTGRNDTGFSKEDNISTGVYIDNGAPTATYGGDSLLASTKIYQSGGSFIISTASDSTIGIRNCTIWFGTNTAVITASSNQCNNTMYPGNFSLAGDTDYTYLIQVRDANGNTTNTSGRLITIYPGDSTSSGAGGLVSGEPVIDGTPTGDGAPTPTQPNAIVRFFQAIANWFRNLFS